MATDGADSHRGHRLDSRDHDSHNRIGQLQELVCAWHREVETAGHTIEDPVSATRCVRRVGRVSLAKIDDAQRC